MASEKMPHKIISKYRHHPNLYLFTGQTVEMYEIGVLLYEQSILIYSNEFLQRRKFVKKTAVVYR